MCEYCKKPICPPACPSYVSDVPLTLGVIGICSKCGKRLFRGEIFSYILNRFYCGACAEEAGLKARLC